MANVLRGMVDGIGITDFEDLPEHPSWFTEISIPEVVTIPCQKPDIEQLISVMVDAKVISTRVVNTPESISREGQVLTGRKLIFEIKLKQKITYVADEPTQSVHAAHFEKVISSVFVIVPKTITISGKDVTIETLLKQNKIVVTPYIEDIFGELKDKRTIFKNITLLVDVTVSP
jgi:hypothetical protein